MKQTAPSGLLASLSSGIKLSIILLLFFLLIVTQFSVQINWPYASSNVRKAIYLHRFFADFFLFAAFIVLFFGRSWLSRFWSYAIACLFVLVYFTQAQSYLVTGGFLPSIALENADHIDFLDTDNHFFAGFIWCVFLFLAAFSIHKWVRPLGSMSARVICFLMLMVISIGVKNDKKMLSEELVTQRFEFFNAGIPRFPPVSPVSELLDTLKEYREYVVRQKFVAKNAGILTADVAEYAYDYHGELGVIDQEYPLLKSAVYETPLPFLAEPSSDQKMNVIVFFVEGISARIIQPYGDRFPGMSPNILEFSKSAIQVNNYYNHAYATYRGLGGQLCSIYPVGRLYVDTDYYCLGHALKDEGYSTRFMVSQMLEKTDLDRVFRSAGFESVDGAKELASLLALPNPDNPGTTSDRELVDGLILRLREQESIAQESPFLIGLYNFETHTGVKLRDGFVYNYPEKDNSIVLDPFHNFDRVFGEFWRYFKNSPHYKNTIVVVTSDHATYPARSYVDLMRGEPGYAPIFADEIPLLIYHPDAIEGTEIDARSATSLNLAPSLLRLMGINKELVPFLGRSIFEEDNTFPTPSASGGLVLWNKRGPSSWLRITNSTRDDFRVLAPDAVVQQEFMIYVQSLEQANKIWKK